MNLKIMKNKDLQKFKEISLAVLNNDGYCPCMIEKGDWIDPRAAETVTLKKGDFKLISLGVSIELPEGCEAHIVPRSSTFKTWGIIQTNSMGVIDESYCGDNDIWKMPVLATRDIVINKNDRICQFRVFKKMDNIDFCEVEILQNDDRGGFGSTGKW